MLIQRMSLQIKSHGDIMFLNFKEVPTLCWVISHTGNSGYKLSYHMPAAFCSHIATLSQDLYLRRERQTIWTLIPSALRKRVKFLVQTSVQRSPKHCAIVSATPILTQCFQELVFPDMAVTTNHLVSVWNMWRQLQYLCMIFFS